MIATRIFFTLLFFVSVISFGKPQDPVISEGYKGTKPGFRKGCNLPDRLCYDHCLPSWKTPTGYEMCVTADHRGFIQTCYDESGCGGSLCATACD